MPALSAFCAGAGTRAGAQANIAGCLIAQDVRVSPPKTLIAGVGLILIAAMAGGCLAAWWLFRHVDARVLLADQPATVTLPGPMRVKADVLDALDVLIDGDIATTVPIDQTLQVPIKDVLHVMTTVDSDVPIKMTVPIRNVIPVDQIVHVDTKVQVDVLGRTLTLPVRGDIPVKTTVPLSIDVPVDQLVRIRFTAPTEVRIKDALSVPLKARVAAVVPIHSEMKVPVRSALEAEITVPGPIQANIVRTDLRLPLHTLQFGMNEAAGDKAAGGRTP